jgi:hypothetical protein
MPRDLLPYAACRLHQALLAHRRALSLRPEGALVLRPELTRCLRLADRLARAEAHHYDGAARRLREALRWSIAESERQLETWRTQLNPRLPPLPSPLELLAELEQLAEEFGELALARGSKELIATTEPITLEGIELGPFAIHLNLTAPVAGARDAYPAYRVIALAPQPAAGASHLHHPHVSHEQLCAGEAAAPIRQALLGGRIGEFYLLVRAVLETFNSSSAYAQLEDWLGSPCSDCGAMTDSDECSHCARCEDLLCGDCGQSCAGCDDVCCAWHSTACQRCGSTWCPACRDEALTDGHCQLCREALGLDDDPEPEEDDDADPEPTDAEPLPEENAHVSTAA